jgi:hypothetical protein
MEISGKLHGPAALPPGKSPGTLLEEGWVGSRAGLGAEKKKIIPTRAGNRTAIVKP